MFSSKHPLVTVFDVALSNQLSRVGLTEEIAKLGREVSKCRLEIEFQASRI